MRCRSVIAPTFASATFRSRSSIRSPILQLHIQLWSPFAVPLPLSPTPSSIPAITNAATCIMASHRFVWQKSRMFASKFDGILFTPRPAPLCLIDRFGDLGSTVNCNLLSLQPMCCKSCPIDLLPLLLLYRFRWPSLLLLLPWITLCYSIKGFGLTLWTRTDTDESSVRLYGWLVGSGHD